MNARLVCLLRLAVHAHTLRLLCTHTLLMFARPSGAGCAALRVLDERLHFVRWVPHFVRLMVTRNERVWCAGAHCALGTLTLRDVHVHFLRLMCTGALCA